MAGETGKDKKREREKEKIGTRKWASNLKLLRQRVITSDPKRKKKKKRGKNIFCTMKS